MFNLNDITKDWTLFLDRDGVINIEKHEDYIHTWEEFVFYPGVKEAIKIFAKHFGHIIIVTNQRGIGKGVTKEHELQRTHRNMILEIEKAGGRIDNVYYSPDLDNNSPTRKPNTGMAMQAKKDFPEIDLSCSVMIGNTLSDMEFGRNIGAGTIFLPTTRPEVRTDDHRIDAVYPSLIAFAEKLEEAKQ